MPKMATTLRGTPGTQGRLEQKITKTTKFLPTFVTFCKDQPVHDPLFAVVGQPLPVSGTLSPTGTHVRLAGLPLCRDKRSGLSDDRPGFPDKLPGNADVFPDFEDKLPGCPDAFPGSKDKAPGCADDPAKRGASLPGFRDALPEFNDASPRFLGNSLHMTGVERLVTWRFCLGLRMPFPDSRETFPDFGISLPDSGMGLPNSMMLLPSAGTAFPDSGTSFPDSRMTPHCAGQACPN